MISDAEVEGLARSISIVVDTMTAAEFDCCLSAETEAWVDATRAHRGRKTPWP
jgi:hypothetical protein